VGKGGEFEALWAARWPLRRFARRVISCSHSRNAARGPLCFFALTVLADGVLGGAGAAHGLTEVLQVSSHRVGCGLGFCL